MDFGVGSFGTGCTTRALFMLPRLCKIPIGNNGPIVKLSIGCHQVKFWQMYTYPVGVKMLQLLEYPKIGPR
jgi:hypothetical protein